MPTTTAPIRTNLRNVDAYIQQRIDFDCNGTLSGHSRPGTEKGQLPVKYWSDLVNASDAPDFFVVKSYITPIAWFANGAWFVPNVKYSPTTSRHLSALKLPLNWGATRPSFHWVTMGGI